MTLKASPNGFPMGAGHSGSPKPVSWVIGTHIWLQNKLSLIPFGMRAVIFGSVVTTEGLPYLQGEAMGS